MGMSLAIDDDHAGREQMLRVSCVNRDEAFDVRMRRVNDTDLMTGQGLYARASNLRGDWPRGRQQRCREQEVDVKNRAHINEPKGGYR